jgi:endonuclease V-like protein UPF0215 family
MKSQIRILGIDDSPFSFDDGTTSAIGVVMRVPSYIEAVMRCEVEVDGSDANKQLAAMINSSRYKEQLKLVMLDGVALGGFNIVDIGRLFREIGVPIVTVTREEPDLVGMESALKEHFEDWRERLDVIRFGELHRIETDHKPLFVKFIGLDLEDLKEIIELSIVRGALPEALRVAHLIATGFVHGESHGRA